MNLFDDVDISELPSKIEMNVLLNATIEVRFDSNIYAEMIVWPLYEKIKKEYEKPQMFPVAQIPQDVRKQNPNFNSVLLYAINGKNNISIGCGDGILNITLLNFSYDTWDKLFEQFKIIYGLLEDTIPNIKRVGVRYINVINKEYVNPDNFTFNFIVRDKTLLNMPLMSVFEFDIDEKKAKVNISNKVQYKYLEKGEQKTQDNALVIDIDVIDEKDISNRELGEATKDCHTSLKKIFFGLCSQKFINDELHPISNEA